MMNRKLVKIVAFVLAGLMVLTGLTVLVSVFAADGAQNARVWTLGDTGEYILVGGIGALAVLVVVLCIVVPKLKKKNISDADDDTAADEIVDDNEN